METCWSPLYKEQFTPLIGSSPLVKPPVYDWWLVTGNSRDGLYKVSSQFSSVFKLDKVDNLSSSDYKWNSLGYNVKPQSNKTLIIWLNVQD